MKGQIVYFLLSFILILFSTPLGYKTLNLVYYNKNLTGEFDILLNWFIASYMLIGILFSVMGFVKMIIKKKHK